MKIPRILAWSLGGLVLTGAIAAYAISRMPTTITISTAENGGFTPDHLQARAGQALHLRLVAEDVEQTFAVGQYPMEPVLLEPHQPKTITLTFDTAGTYTFYTTTPSSLNFWRVRGTIDVSGGEPAPAAMLPLYVRLGLSLDDENESGQAILELAYRSSAMRGAAFADRIDPSYLTWDYNASHSPLEAFEELRGTSSLSDEQVWDMVAYIWEQNSSASELAAGKMLYQTYCAACHGITGAGDGQFAAEMAALEEQNTGEMGIEAPTDFRQPEHLLGSPPAVVQGLILRGGMGTGMPMWGTIFTAKQTWDLTAYLYSFQFDYSQQTP
jgi:mono/diheme cytochrome c family protein/plastocyanin